MSNKDAVALLKHDHETVKSLFEQVNKLNKRDSDKKERVFDEIKAALEVHATIEEEIFYPAVKKARSEHVKDEIREAYEEHKKIKQLLAKISDITASDERFDSKVKELKETVEHHVSEEEGEMFGDAKKYLGEPRLIELGAQLEARKGQLEKHPTSKSSSSGRQVSH